LDVNELLVSEVAAAVNKHRATLGLEALESVTADTDLSAGAAVSGDAPASAYNKISALRDIDALAGYLAEHPGLAAAAGDLSASLEELESDPTILDALEHRQLIEVGLPLVVDGSCPLCDHIWPDAEDLRVHLQGKLARSDAANALKKRTNAATQRVVTELQRARALVETALPHATTVGRTEDHAALLGWSNELAGFEAHLGGLETIRPHAQRLREDPLAVPASLTKSLGALRLAIESLPDQSAADSARTALTIAQERSTHLRQARAGSSKAAAVHETAESVYQAYTEVADQSLLTLYQTVQDRFSEFYSRINADDESSFKAGLTPSSGKLDFDVDFYGLGMFPPTAYHSEGHQDGMGVCLYLALIEQLLQDDFRLAVLDDVVTSVDVNHRREFCKLLKEGFPDVQFIITTHDEVWARLMQSSGLIGRKSLGRFHGWSVDGGPVYAQSGNAWSQIENDLAEDDVPGAAHKLRRSLEASMADIAANLRASVVYRPDNSYELGALFAAAKRRHGDLLKRAADAASSWNDEEAKQRVDALKAERAKAMLAQDDENWAINALVHNNDWANMTKADFAPVVEACKQFSELFACTNDGCDSLIYLVGGPGAEEALRCSCGKLNLNLRRKK
jgi:hypothetical protein